jgi:hypothetical protein
MISVCMCFMGYSTSDMVHKRETPTPTKRKTTLLKGDIACPGLSQSAAYPAVSPCPLMSFSRHVHLPKVCSGPSAKPHIARNSSKDMLSTPRYPVRTPDTALSATECIFLLCSHISLTDAGVLIDTMMCSWPPK